MGATPLSSNVVALSCLHSQPLAVPGTALVVGWPRIGPCIGSNIVGTTHACGACVQERGFTYGLGFVFATEGQQVAPGVTAATPPASPLFGVSDSKVVSELGRPALVVYSVQAFTPGTVLQTEVAAFEHCWRANCLGAYIVAREAARDMVRDGTGTIVFVGATSGTMGRAGYVNLATGKFGLRALAQVMARELHPRGVHICHLIIDADVAEDVPREGDEPQASPDDIASLIHFIHAQPRTAWTHELDVRPWDEKFWEHC